LSSTSSTMNTNLLLILLATIVVSAYSYKCPDGTVIHCGGHSFGNCCPGERCAKKHHDHGGPTYSCESEGGCKHYHELCQSHEDCCSGLRCEGIRCEDHDD